MIKLELMMVCLTSQITQLVKAGTDELTLEAASEGTITLKLQL